MLALIYYFNGSHSLLQSLIKPIIAIIISVSKSNEDYCTAGDVQGDTNIHIELVSDFVSNRKKCLRIKTRF